MRAKRVFVVGIALFIASCATVAGKSAQSTPVGLGSNQQGRGLNGQASDAQDGADRATGMTVEAVRVVGGQLVWGAAR